MDVGNYSNKINLTRIGFLILQKLFAYASHDLMTNRISHSVENAI